MLLGSLCGAGYVVVAHRVTATVDPLVLTAFQFVVGLLVTLPVTAVAVLAGWEPVPHRLGAGPMTAAVLTGVFGSALAFWLYSWALARVSPSEAGVSLNAIPVFGFALSVVVLGDPLGSRSLLACAVIVVGLLLCREQGEQGEPSELVEPGEVPG